MVTGLRQEAAMTIVTRAGTLQTQSFVLEQINKNLAQYVDLQQQITTGYKTQRYEGMADESAMTINMANNDQLLTQYMKSGDIANSRLSGMGNAVSNILDIVTRFRAQLLQAMTADQADDGRIDIVADGALKEVEAALNTDLGGVYLFGGTRNDVPPVDLSDPIRNANGTYYTGAGELMQARVDANTVLSYGATADRQGFRDLVASLQRVTSGSASLTELEAALDDLNASLTDLTQMQAELGHQMKVAEGAKTRNDAIKATVEIQLGNLRDVDISAAMVKLTQREAILQASYAVVARSNQLSLINYLR
jgi:flagellar hook-associated protein 3 FlgL